MYVAPEKDFLPLAGMDTSYEPIRMRALEKTFSNPEVGPVGTDPIRLTQIDGNMGMAVISSVNAPKNGTGAVVVVFDFGAIMVCLGRCAGISLLFLVSLSLCLSLSLSVSS